MLNGGQKRLRVTKRYAGAEQRKQVKTSNGGKLRVRKHRKLVEQGLACPRVLASKDDAELLEALKDASVPVTIDPAWREEIEREMGRQWWNEQIKNALANPVKTNWYTNENEARVIVWPDGTKTFIPKEIYAKLSKGEISAWVSSYWSKD